MRRGTYIKRFDERIQRYAIKKSTLNRYYERIGKHKGRALFQYKLYRSLAALSYSPNIESDEDCRVWVYDKSPRERNTSEMEKELERFMKAIRLGAIERHVESRVEIGQFITRDQAEPSNFRIGQFYGYLQIKGYEYHGEKTAIKWVVRDSEGIIRSGDLRKEGLK
jgi:hypothetical protein